MRIKSRYDRERIIKKLENKVKGGVIKVSDLLKNSGEKKYLKINKKCSQTGTIDKEKIALEEKWDGLYGVMTNYRDKEISPDDIMTRHSDLWQIENAFRVNKHDLKMRPIYHWTPRRIESHILICFIAYSLMITLKYRLRINGIKLSIAGIREELSFVQASICPGSSK